LGLKVSDEFTVPLCRWHHHQLHNAGNEISWWNDLKINALEFAQTLWTESRAKKNPAQDLRGAGHPIELNKSVSSGNAAPIKD
jgi:gentisate 1,2-dioxygenase